MYTYVLRSCGQPNDATVKPPDKPQMVEIASNLTAMLLGESTFDAKTEFDYKSVTSLVWTKFLDNVSSIPTPKVYEKLISLMSTIGAQLAPEELSVGLVDRFYICKNVFSSFRNPQVRKHNIMGMNTIFRKNLVVKKIIKSYEEITRMKSNIITKGQSSVYTSELDKCFNTLKRSCAQELFCDKTGSVKIEVIEVQLPAAIDINILREKGN